MQHFLNVNYGIQGNSNKRLSISDGTADSIISIRLVVTLFSGIYKDK